MGCTFITLESQSQKMKSLPISAYVIWLWLSNVIKVQPLMGYQRRNKMVNLYNFDLEIPLKKWNIYGHEQYARQTFENQYILYFHL